MKKVFLLILYFIMFKINAQLNDFKHIDFTRAKNSANLYKGENLNNLTLLTHKLTKNLATDVEKFKAIYTWVCQNIKYDFKAYHKISSQKKKFKNNRIAYINWQNKYKKEFFEKLLHKKQTICTGYAYLLKEMAFLAGIECKIIDGYGRNGLYQESLDIPDHSWNAVKLNNKWYLCDATWASGYIGEDYTFLHNLNEGYFLTDPELFAKNHYPVKTKWLLGAKQTELTFLNTPIIYDSTFEYKIIPILPAKLKSNIKKLDTINFKLKTLKSINPEKISLVYYNTNDREIKLKLTKLSYHNNLLSFKHIFSKRGVYDIHLKLNQEIISSYTITSIAN